MLERSRARRFIRRTGRNDIVRTLEVVLVGLAIAGLVLFVVRVRQQDMTQVRQGQALAKQAFELAKLNRREFQIENPTDTQLRQRIDRELAKFTQRERERLLRLLLSAVSPRTLELLIQQGNLAHIFQMPLLPAPQPGPAPSAGHRQGNDRSTRPSPHHTPTHPVPARPAPSTHTTPSAPPPTAPSAPVPAPPKPAPSIPSLPVPALPVTPPALPRLPQLCCRSRPIITLRGWAILL